VRFFKGGAETNSVVMRSKSRTIRYIQSIHHFEHKPTTDKHYIRALFTYPLGVYPAAREIVGTAVGCVDGPARGAAALLALGAGLSTPEQDEKIDRWSGWLRSRSRGDRSDWASVAAWARPLVVLRGLLDRAVLRALAGKRAPNGPRRGCGIAEGSLSDAKGLLRRCPGLQEDRRGGRRRLQPLPSPSGAQHFSKYLWTEAKVSCSRRAGADRAGGRLPHRPDLHRLQLTATLHSWGLGEGRARRPQRDPARADFWLRCSQQRSVVRRVPAGGAA